MSAPQGPATPDPSNPFPGGHVQPAVEPYISHPDQYPPPQGSGPGAPNYGYPFPVEGPTAPAAPGDVHPGVPYEYEPPATRYFDPTYGGPRPPHHPHMPNDPFKTSRIDQETEFGWGPGQYPDPILDYSGGGGLSRFPIAQPDVITQHWTLAAIRRTDVSDPFAPVDPYVPGNPDRFGAQPPLVRVRGRYKRPKYKQPKPPRMHREW